MMRTAFGVILLLAVLLAAGSCKSIKNTSDSEKKENAAEQLLPITFYDKPFDSLKTDYFNVDSVSVENQALVVYVNYGGGCGDATFEMFYKPQMTTVMPHRSNLFLKLTDNDPCRSVVTKKLIFDLSAMNREAKAGGVVLHLNDKQLMYKIKEQ